MNTKSCDIERKDKGWDLPNDPQYGKELLMYWIAGFGLGAFVVVCTTYALLHFFPCIARQIWGFCSVH